jgi:hypothetical protein
VNRVSGTGAVIRNVLFRAVHSRLSSVTVTVDGSGSSSVQATPLQVSVAGGATLIWTLRVLLSPPSSVTVRRTVKLSSPVAA